MLLPALLLAVSCHAAIDAKKAQLEFLRGELLQRKGSYAEALIAYEAALESDPGSAYINRQAAELALEAGDNAKAHKYASKAAELQPKDAPTLTLLGRVLWELDNTAEARAAFEKAMRLDPKHGEAVYALGALIAEKSPEKARELLNRFLDSNPAEAGEVHFQLAKVEQAAGRQKAAQKEFKQAIALTPEDESIPARYALAQSYEAEHSTDAAIGAYLDLLKIDSANPTLLNHLAELFFNKGDWESMRRMLALAKQAQPDDPTANHWLALDAEKRGEWDEAAALLRSSAAFKDDAGLWLRLSYYLTQANKLDEAVVTLEQAHQHWPNNEQVQYFLALGYDDQKKPEKAIPLLRKVLALKPGSRDARYQLAVLLEKTGKWAEAEPEFRRILADSPDDASVLNYIGFSLADRGEKLDEAEALIRRALAVEPQSGAYIDSLGWVHFKQGRFKEALPLLRAAAKKLPDDDQVWDHLGDAAFASGDEDAAWIYWKRSESLVASGVTLKGKAAKQEKRLTPDELGEAYIDYLQLVHGGVKKITGVCELNVEILKQPSSYKCLFTLKPDQEEIAVDLLGPLMMPVFRLRLAGDLFQMDALRIEGVDPEAVKAGAYESLRLMRAYLGGAAFVKPAVHKKSWGKRSIENKKWRLNLDRAAVRVENVLDFEAPGYQLCLEDFGRVEGRQMPRTLSVSGKGFKLKLRFDDAKIIFEPR